MEQEEFLRRLQEYAKIKQNYVPRTGAIREASEPCLIDRHGQTVEISLENNPTMSWVIDKIQIEPQECSDCGRELTNSRKITRQVYIKPKPHWRESCQNCSLTRDPETGCFTLKGVHIHNRFVEFFKNKSNLNNNNSDNNK